MDLQKKPKRWHKSIILSLFFHGAVFLLLIWQAQKNSQKPPESIELEILNTPASQVVQSENANEENKQIVTQSDHSVNEELVDTKYLSAKNQHVKEETRAAKTGVFRNSGQTGGASPQKSRTEKAKTTFEELQAETKKETPPSFMAEKTKSGLPTLQALKPKFQWNPSEGIGGTTGVGEASATTDFLKDKKLSGQTMLNTREFIYYSYYNRIKSQLEQYWSPAVKRKMKRIFAQGREIASDVNHITKVIITLDKNGLLTNVQVISASGVQDLDEAAIEAFRAAAPFPHPPNGIVESDGTIKIRWDFILES